MATPIQSGDQASEIEEHSPLFNPTLAAPPAPPPQVPKLFGAGANVEMPFGFETTFGTVPAPTKSSPSTGRSGFVRPSLPVASFGFESLRLPGRDVRKQPPSSFSAQFLQSTGLSDQGAMATIYGMRGGHGEDFSSSSSNIQQISPTSPVLSSESPSDGEFSHVEGEDEEGHVGDEGEVGRIRQKESELQDALFTSKELLKSKCEALKDVQLKLSGIEKRNEENLQLREESKSRSVEAMEKNDEDRKAAAEREKKEKKEFLKMKEDIEEKDRQLENYEKQIDDRDKQIEKLEKSVQSQQDQIIKIGHQRDEAEKIRKETEKGWEVQQSELEVLRKNNEVLSGDLQDKIDEVEKFKDDLGKETSERTRAEFDLRNLSIDSDEKDKKLKLIPILQVQLDEIKAQLVEHEEIVAQRDQAVAEAESYKEIVTRQNEEASNRISIASTQYYPDDPLNTEETFNGSGDDLYVASPNPQRDVQTSLASELEFSDVGSDGSTEQYNDTDHHDDDDAHDISSYSQDFEGSLDNIVLKNLNYTSTASQTDTNTPVLSPALELRHRIGVFQETLPIAPVVEEKVVEPQHRSLSKIQVQQTTPVPELITLPSLKLSTIRSESTRPIVPSIEEPVVEPQHRSLSKIEFQETTPVPELLTLPSLKLSAIRTENTSPIAAPPPTPQVLKFNVPGAFKETIPIPFDFSPFDSSDPSAETSIKSTDNKKSSAPAPLDRSKYNDASISAQLPTPPTTPTTIIIRVPTQISNHDIFTSWFMAHRQFLQLVFLIMSSIFGFKFSPESRTTGITPSSSGPLPTPDTSSVEQSDEEGYVNISSAETVQSSSPSTLNNRTQNITTNAAPTTSNTKTKQKQISTQHHNSSFLTPDLETRTFILKHRRRITYNFISYLFFYYLLFQVSIVLRQRAAWFHANETTRSLLTSMLAYRKNTNSRSFFSLRRWFPENVSRAARMGFIYGAESGQFVVRGFKLPG